MQNNNKVLYSFVVTSILMSITSFLVGYNTSAGRMYQTNINTVSQNDPQTTQKENGENQKIGILAIPDLQIFVPLFYGDLYGNPDDTQEIVDRKDSAAYMEYETNHVIADHVEQEFKTLKNAAPGMNAFVLNEDGTYTSYTCISSGAGRNNDEELTDADGTGVSKLINNGLIIYTCNKNWEDITLTLWE